MADARGSSKKEADAMRVCVDADLCDGCGPCEEVCPEVFQVIDNVARVQVEKVPPEAASACRLAARNCPTDAIKIEE